VDGKDLWWMHLYIRMHRCMTWRFLKVNIILLMQAGYLSSQGFLISYCGVHYHLAEWGHAGVRSVRYTITVPYLF
jgi:hypothetical protein